MAKIVLFRVFVLVILPIALLLGGCSSEESTFSSKTGKISVEVFSDLNIRQSQISRDAEDEYTPEILNNISVENLKLTLKNREGSFSKEWESINDFSPEEEFPVGLYILSASYGSPTDEGVDEPYIYGEKEFNIQGAKTVDVELTAKVTSALVGIEFTENFLNYFQASAATLKTSLGNSFIFSRNESSPVFINPGATRIMADVTLPSGESGSVEVGTFEAQEATYHRITIDVDASRGDLRLMLIFDDTLEEEVIEREISSELFDAGVPVVIPEGFSGNEKMPFVEGNTANNQYKFNITARRGIKEAWLTMTSLRYGGGFQERYNLINEQTQIELSKEHGIRFIGIASGEIFGKIDLTEWLKDLRRYDRSAISEDVTFTLTVIDSAGKTTEDELSMNNNLNVVLYGESLIVEPYDDITETGYYFVKVSTNMNWLSGRLQITQTEGDEVELPVYSVMPDSVIDPTYQTLNSYIIKIPEPQVLFKYKQNVVSNSGVSANELTFIHALPKIQISYNQSDIYATHGRYSVTALVDGNSEILYDKIMRIHNGKITTVIKCADDESIVVYPVNSVGNIYKYENLPFSEEKLAAQQPMQLRCYAQLEIPDIEEKSTASTLITTEAPLQLFNGDMEHWTRQAGGTNYWWVDYLDSNETTSWNTVNGLTTSQGGNSTLGTGNSRNGCAYNANSGTQPTTESVSGNAAWIRTVGWGAGNTAGVFGGFANCYHVDAGELYLGTFDALSLSPVYGCDFASRPQKITFWYKYSTVTANDDKGFVRAAMYDSSGNTIFEKELLLDAISSYTKMEIVPDYADNASSAAKFVLIFKSSNKSSIDLLSKVNSTYMTPPPASNLTNGEYLGSKLYIDDVVLVY